MGEWMYGSTFSSRRHYLEASGQLHVPAALPSVPTGEYDATTYQEKHKLLDTILFLTFGICIYIYIAIRDLVS
jgi:hypothetical protein